MGEVSTLTNASNGDAYLHGHLTVMEVLNRRFNVYLTIARSQLVKSERGQEFYMSATVLDLALQCIFEEANTNPI